MHNSITVVVVDGHTLTRYGLIRLVGADGDIAVVGECGLAAEAADLITSTQPDVVVLDVALPDADGLQLARELRDRHHDLGIVVLTAQSEDAVLFRALETGVSAFVDETAPNAEVLGAIRHAAVAACSFTATGLATALARSGHVTCSGPATAPGPVTAPGPATGSGRLTGPGELPELVQAAEVSSSLTLSPREYEVLSLLATGLSVPAIAATMFISHSTAKTYVARIYEKLAVTNRANAIITAMRLGILNPELSATA